MISDLVAGARRYRRFEWLRGWLSGRGDRSARCDPGRPGLRAMIVLAVLVALGAGCWVWTARPHQLPAAASTSMAAGRSAVAPGGSLASPATSRPAGPAGSSSAIPALVVDVVGKVHRPGLYRLPPGARVGDAVTAAGGVLGGVDPVSVNLARKLTDGEQVIIGVAAGAGPPGATAEPGGSVTGSGSPNGSGGTVDLNTASVSQLDALPGVGPVLAQRIVDWRTQHGRFDSVDQLQSVSGIGDAKFVDLKPLVSVG